MNPRGLAALALITAGALLGCEKDPADTGAQIAPPAASPPEVSPRVATDPSLPPTEAALAKPKSATDATGDTELTRTERDKEMPLAGQANDHSNPEFAKRGDDAAPAKSTN